MTAATALILDFGGVLTSDFWEALRSFARREGLPNDTLVDLVTKDPAGSGLLRGLERGDIDQAQFEQEIAAHLGVPSAGLLERMAADLRPGDQMLDVIAELRARGVKVAVLSNSWGSDYFDPYAPWKLEDRVDAVIRSDRVHLRKPEPAIFDLAVDELNAPASECVFVDDIAAYLEPAQALGMTVIHHVHPDATIAELRRLFAAYLR